VPLTEVVPPLGHDTCWHPPVPVPVQLCASAAGLGSNTMASAPNNIHRSELRHCKPRWIEACCFQQRRFETNNVSIEHIVDKSGSEDDLRELDTCCMKSSPVNTFKADRAMNDLRRNDL
jgi:hypothetical protein